METRTRVARSRHSMEFWGFRDSESSSGPDQAAREFLSSSCDSQYQVSCSLGPGLLGLSPQGPIL